MKRLLYSIILATAASHGVAQSTSTAPDTSTYEVQRAMPSFYRQLKAQLDYPMAWGRNDIGDFATWRDSARSVVLQTMQNLQPRALDYAIEVVATEQRDGYVAQKIRFNINAWSRVPAYLLVPDEALLRPAGAELPAILMLHDHGAHFMIGKEKVVRPFAVADTIAADAQAWIDGGFDGQFIGDYFAAHGYVVLAVDALLWGERSVQKVDRKGRPHEPTRQEVYDTQQALSANFLQMGSSWGAYITADDIYSAEFLGSLPYVDPRRVGSFGWSMGAYRSWMASALSDAIAASANVCWMSTTESLMTLDNNQNRGGSAYAMLVPGLRRYLDYPHVASIACPKPTLFYNGIRDHLFPVDGVEAAFAEMRSVWHSQQADDRLVTQLWDERHHVNLDMQAQILQFFDRWLRPER